MRRLAGGHDQALNQLIERHAEKLLAYLLRQLQNQADAEELAQETFVRVYQNRRKFDPRQKFSTWLYAIATNLVKDKYRWRSRHPTVPLDEPLTPSGDSLGEVLADQQAGPGDLLADREDLDLLRRAVAELPEELRTALILSEYQDCSHAEIASVLHCSVKAVEGRIHRAREHLRKALARRKSEIK